MVSRWSHMFSTCHSYYPLGALLSQDENGTEFLFHNSFLNCTDCYAAELGNLK